MKHSVIGLALGALVFAQSALSKNVVLFLGDGMGISTVTAARIFAGQQQGLPGEEYNLSFDKFENVALIKTYNINSQVSDSAGTISAILTGEKTNIGFLGVNQSVARGDCAQSLRNTLPTLAELAEQAGLATGVVSTARITHATPAGMYAHVPDRNWENSATLPADAREAGCRDIAQQMIEFAHGDGLDVILGGGRAQFMPTSEIDPEYSGSEGGSRKTGLRNDDRNLLREWLAGAPGRKYVWNAEQFSALKPAPGQQVLGLFEPSHMQFEADRAKDAAGEPSLAEMTRFAIESLQHHTQGFLLLVEAGRIDHAHHFGNAYRALVDTVALSDAVAVAHEMTNPEETLIVVTADHSHTLTISGYPARGNPILGKVEANPVLKTNDPVYTTLTYANGPGYQAKYPDLSDTDTEDPNYRQVSAVPLVVETHAGEDVAAYATGVNSQAVRGVMEQNRLFHAMRDVLLAPPAESAAVQEAPGN